jgi:nucleoside-diphosphate-sugar epimerase
MKVVLLGGSGFIGSAVLYELEANPSITEIRALSNKRKVHPSEKVHVYRSTLADIDEKMLVGVDAVVHLARMNARRFGRWGRSWAAVRGAQANKRLLKLLWKHSPQARVIYVSGSLMYGNSDDARETSPLNPISFAREYVIAERPLLKAIQEGKNVLLLRFPWVLGKGSWFRTFFLNPALSQGKIPCYGPGDNTMSFVDLRDAASVVVQKLYDDNCGIQNVAMEDKASQREFVEALSEILGKPIKPWSMKKLEAKQERAVVEAFTSSINLNSDQDIHLRHNDWRKSLREMLQA